LTTGASVDCSNKETIALDVCDKLEICPFYFWHKANWKDLMDYIYNVSWGSLFTNIIDAEECWNIFCQVIWFGIDLFVPKVINSKRRNNIQVKKNKVIRYPKKIKRLRARKLLLWRRYRKNKTKVNKAKYNKAAKEYKFCIDQNATEIEKEILNCNDLGKFYKYINSKLSSKSGVGPLKNKDGNFVFDSLERADVLNKYFSSVCVKDNTDKQKKIFCGYLGIQQAF